MPTPTGKSTRAERLAQPLAREVAEQLAADDRACIRASFVSDDDITAMAEGYGAGSSLEDEVA
ncbi:hypothetical protein [Nocardiopsis valliformis]|uniref:hypothetical protein n=1 Tax=Nocardiopsis valliformis TaxID=239974 RepID=UPI000349BCCF|nr:hypothetical protein [Nocardiopsis valliformis]